MAPNYGLKVKGTIEVIGEGTPRPRPAKPFGPPPAVKKALFGTMLQHEKELRATNAIIITKREDSLQDTCDFFYDKNDKKKLIGFICTNDDGHQNLTIGASNTTGTTTYRDYDGDGIPDQKETDGGCVDKPYLTGKGTRKAHPVLVENGGKDALTIEGPSCNW